MLKGIGERLKKAREAQGLSQRELSKMTGIAQEAICRCETETVLPSSKTITKLARALSLDLNYLLDGEENGTIEFYGDYFDKGSKSRILPLDIPDNSNFFSLRAEKGYPCGIEENDILVLRPVNAPTSDETVLVESLSTQLLIGLLRAENGHFLLFQSVSAPPLDISDDKKYKIVAELVYTIRKYGRR